MRNPPSFILVEKATGRVVYTKRATGVGSEAIAACVKKGRELALKTGKIYFVYLDIAGARVGSMIHVGMAYHMGITEEIGPQGSAMPSGRRCCSAPDVRPSGQGMRCMNCQHWEADSYFKNPGRVRRNIFTWNNPRRARKNIFTWNNPPSGPADEHAARELELYIENDAQLYRSQFIPIVKNLMLKRRKGVYNRELAVTLFMYLMDAGAKKYVVEFGTRGQKIDSMFNRNTRLQTARSFRDSFEAEAELGNYDRLIGPVSNPRTREYPTHTAILPSDPINGSMKVSYTTRKGGYKKVGGVNIVEAEDEVRRNIFTWNNPRKLNSIEQAASEAGLTVATWAPGDGSTRYRFFKAKPGGRGPWADYHQGDAVYTAMGRKDAMSFIVAYQMGRHTRRENPSKVLRAFRVPRGYEQRVERLLRNAFIYAQAESGQVVTFARPEIVKKAIQVVLSGKDLQNNPSREAQKFISSEIGHLRRKGYEPKRAAAAAYSMARRKGYRVNPSPIDPPGLAELDARMNDLMRRMDAMKKAKTDNGPEYMILLKEAQAVSRERLKLIGLGSKVLPNPLLQTVLSSMNPPISDQWARMTRRQREAVLEVVGYDRDYQGGMTSGSWSSLPIHAKKKLEAQWLDTTSSGGTTRRRRMPVAVNPLTRRESTQILKRAKNNLRTAQAFVPGFTRSEKSGQAFARGMVVKQYGPRGARRVAGKVIERAQKVAGTTFSNPGVKFPKPGTRLTIAEALYFAEKLGNRELIKQCHEAMELQKAANKNAKSVTWKIFPMGSKDKIDQVVALTHYGDSPETMYRPPKGSKKGSHMYRHKWGEQGGKSSVPLLASPDGKMLIMPLEGKKIASDWLRH